jgi:hypothetical protein
MSLHYDEQLIMLFREIIAVYFKNHRKHINTLYRQNADYVNIETSVMFSKHWALKS